MRRGRTQVNFDQTPARFPAGTLARLDAVLAEGESRADMIRSTIEREIARRAAAPPAPPTPRQTLPS